MSNVTVGADALNALNRPDDSGGGAEFTSFKSGTTFMVRVLGASDLIQFFSYGIFGKINSFVAENPSVKTPKGYPKENLTPWDKAWKYHKDLSKDFNDAHGKESSKYRVKERYAMGFIDLDTGEPIIVDVSRNQAQSINAAIMKYESRLGKLAFELSKQGSGTSTSVSLSPVLDFEEDLSSEQQKNFHDAPEKFDMSLFDGLMFEVSDEEQVKLLVQAGFDVTKIGYEVPKMDEMESEGNESSDGEHPF